MIVRKIWKRSRALGISLLENEKEFSKGKKRTYGPGIHGNKRRRTSQSEYALQLKEKSKFRIIFGFKESKLKNTFEKIKLNKKEFSDVGKGLFTVAKSRMDRIIFESKLTKTKAMARQMINHNFFLIDTGKKIKKINSPSYILEPGEKIILKNKNKKNDALINSIIDFYQTNIKDIPNNIKVVLEKKEDSLAVIHYLSYPTDEDYKEFNKNINISLIVDWYNRLV